MTTVGIDIEEISRFRVLLKKGRHSPFMLFTFTESERTYCFSYKDPAPHLAGTFCAKEAIQKARGLAKTPWNIMEIRRTAEGKPEVWLRGKKAKGITLSISHSRSAACAVALCGL